MTRSRIIKGTVGTQLLAALFALLLGYVGIVKSLHHHPEQATRSPYIAEVNDDLGVSFSEEDPFFSCSICDFTFEPAEEISCTTLVLDEGICSVLETPPILSSSYSYLALSSSRAPPCFL